MSLGPWSGDFSVPGWLDVLDVTDRLRGFVGMFAILAAAVFLSNNRRAISRPGGFLGPSPPVGPCHPGSCACRPAQALCPGGARGRVDPELRAGGCPVCLWRALVDAQGPAGFVFAFRVLPTVIFVAALFAVLYHLGVMQWVVRGVAIVMARLMGTSGAESLNVAASLFLGQTEAPLTIRPYLARLTRSELLTVMTSGMAHVSGGVMAAYISYGIEARQS